MTASGTPAPRSVPNGELRVVDDVAGAFARLVASGSAAADGAYRIALSGGATARRCYERLATTDGLAWEHLELFVGDERCVPFDDRDANEALIRGCLGTRLDEVASFHPMRCDEAAAYEALIARSQPLDLVHLGFGRDGHTASLFPGTPQLDSPPGRLVVHSVDPTGVNPHRRLSLTFGAIARSKLAVFTVSGAEKRRAFEELLAGEDLPAARVRAGRVLWLCDPEAAGPSPGE